MIQYSYEEGIVSRRLAQEISKQIAVSLAGGGYFCALFMLRPSAKPKLKQVKQRLINAIIPSSVIIRITLLSLLCFRRLQSEGHNALRRGELTVHHL